MDPIMNLLYALVLLSAGGFVGAYIKQKGQNLATKEDVGEITDRVEAVRREHQEQLERVRSEFAKTVHVHRAQFETELEAYRAVWKALTEAQRAISALGAVMDTQPDEMVATRRRRLEAFFEAFQDYQNAMDKWRPFYPERIYDELSRLVTLYPWEAVDYTEERQFSPGDYLDALRDLEKISHQIDATCEAIRDRIQTLTVVHD